MTQKQIRLICEKYLNDVINEVGMITPGYDDEKNRNYSHMLITFYGGDNACVGDKGKWSRYLIHIKNLIENLEKEFHRAWIVTLSVDCLDDVFSLVVAIDNRRD